jgi:hypothetical protein
MLGTSLNDNTTTTTTRWKIPAPSLITHQLSKNTLALTSTKLGYLLEVGTYCDGMSSAYLLTIAVLPIRYFPSNEKE